jgi:hypothetical protein
LNGEYHPEDLEEELATIKRLEREAVEAAAEPEHAIMRRACGDEFAARHPEYLDTEENARALIFAIRKNGITNPNRLEYYEQGYQELREAGLMKVDAAKDKEQQAVAARARARDEYGRFTADASLSEDDMNELSMDELRDRANRQLRRG